MSMEPRREHNGRSFAFYIETIAVVLLLFLVLSVVVQLFAQAHMATEESERTMAEATTARQIAEMFQSADNAGALATALGGTFDEQGATISADVEYVAGSPMRVTITFEKKPGNSKAPRTAPLSTGAVTDATIAVAPPTSTGSAYMLTTSRYRAGERR